MNKYLARLAIAIIVCIFGCDSVFAANGDSSIGGIARWPNGPIKIHISTSLQSENSAVRGAVISEALAQALSRWETVANVEFEVLPSEARSVSAAGLTGDGISLLTMEATPENLLLFSGDRARFSALTRVFRNAKNWITEADIVLNPFVQFSGDGKVGTYDLELVFTHEVGHLLGLGHSVLPSSVMFNELQPNGLVGGFGREFELSDDDISRVRALYGPRIDEQDCCVRIEGLLKTKSTTVRSVFVVDAVSGAVLQAVPVDSEGRFSAGGLLPGRFELIAEQKEINGVPIGDEILGSIVVGKKEVKRFAASIENRRSDFELRSAGAGGQLSRRPIRVERGKNYQIIVSGSRLLQGDMRFGSSASSISVLSARRISGEFDGEADFVRLEIRVAENVADGNYSIYAEDSEGVRKYLFGVLSVV